MTVHRSAYAIKFTGLPNGIHDFRFELNGRFFENHEDAIIQEAEVEAIVQLNKGTTMRLAIRLAGKVEVECVRCLELVTIPVEVDKNLLVRMVDKPNPEDDDDDSIQIASHAHEIDLEKVFYDYLTLEVPYSPVHPDNADGTPGCDPEVLKFLSKGNDEEKGDEGNEGTWDALKDIKLN